MPFPYATTEAHNAIPLHLFREGDALDALTEAQRGWALTHRFTAKPETSLALPGANGTLEAAAVGVGESLNIWSLAHLPAQLPKGFTYRLATPCEPALLEEMALGFALAQYSFTRYRSSDEPACSLLLPDAASLARVEARYRAIALTRDLINTPTNDMGPTELAEAAREVAQRMGAEITVMRGEELLAHNYPAIHAVGRASTNPPHLIDLRWGNPTHPKVTLIGKGVCFDTGGLDLKPYSSMKLMKKDMGGAALMLGLAQLIADTHLPIRLRVLIPAVENAVSGNAYRPQDVLQTRKGLTVEIGSTDAEGRVILADALAEADSEAPELMIDAATLTGAARTALGTELPALFSTDRAAGNALVETGHTIADPLWQLPLWEPYARYVKSPIADLTNSPNYAYAGAITAALFLQKFVSPERHWMHIDTMAWNIDPRPGRPVGGEALGLRALYGYLSARYSGLPQ